MEPKVEQTTWSLAECTSCHNFVVSPRAACPACGSFSGTNAPYVFTWRPPSTVTVNTPRSPVPWQVRAPNLASAKRQSPTWARQFKAGKPPLEAVRRRLAGMAKGRLSSSYRPSQSVRDTIAAMMEKGKGDVERWVTVGRGEDARHLPIIEGKIAGHDKRDIPIAVAEKIEQHATESAQNMPGARGGDYARHVASMVESEAEEKPLGAALRSELDAVADKAHAEHGRKEEPAKPAETAKPGETQRQIVDLAARATPYWKRGEFARKHGIPEDAIGKLDAGDKIAIKVNWDKVPAVNVPKVEEKPAEEQPQLYRAVATWTPRTVTGGVSAEKQAEIDRQSKERATLKRIEDKHGYIKGDTVRFTDDHDGNGASEGFVGDSDMDGVTVVSSRTEQKMHIPWKDYDGHKGQVNVAAGKWGDDEASSTPSELALSTETPQKPSAPSSVPLSSVETERPTETGLYDRMRHAGWKPSLKADALRGDSALYHIQGDPDFVTLAGNVTVEGKAPSEQDKQSAATLSAIRAAGYEPKNYRAGKLGTTWIMVKDGHALTEAGARQLPKSDVSRRTSQRPMDTIEHAAVMARNTSSPSARRDTVVYDIYRHMNTQLNAGESVYHETDTNAYKLTRGDIQLRTHPRPHILVDRDGQWVKMADDDIDRYALRNGLRPVFPQHDPDKSASKAILGNPDIGNAHRLAQKEHAAALEQLSLERRRPPEQNLRTVAKTGKHWGWSGGSGFPTKHAAEDAARLNQKNDMERAETNVRRTKQMLDIHDFMHAKQKAFHELSQQEVGELQAKLGANGYPRIDEAANEERIAALAGTELATTIYQRHRARHPDHDRGLYPKTVQEWHGLINTWRHRRGLPTGADAAIDPEVHTMPFEQINAYHFPNDRHYSNGIDKDVHRSKVADAFDAGKHIPDDVRKEYQGELGPIDEKSRQIAEQYRAIHSKLQSASKALDRAKRGDSERRSALAREREAAYQNMLDFRTAHIKEFPDIDAIPMKSSTDIKKELDAVTKRYDNSERSDWRTTSELLRKQHSLNHELKKAHRWEGKPVPLTKGTPLSHSTTILRTLKG